MPFCTGQKILAPIKDTFSFAAESVWRAFFGELGVGMKSRSRQVERTD